MKKMKDRKSGTTLCLLAIFLTNISVPTFAADPSQDSAPQSSQAVVLNLDEHAHIETVGENNGVGSTEEIPMTKRNLAIVTGRSQLLRFIQKFNRISVSDPEVLDFLILGPNDLLLNSKKEGSANLIIWDIRNRVSVFDVTVTKDPALLIEVLKQIDPKGKFEIYPSKDVFVVKGEASNSIKVKEVEKATNAFAEGSVTLVKISDVKQILLRIRFIQIDRTQDYDFGLSTELDTHVTQGNILQRFLPGATNAASGSVLQNAAQSDSIFSLPLPTQTYNTFDRNDRDIYQVTFNESNRVFEGFMKALEAKGVVKTIARPNLLAKDGEEASFLVGGEAAIVTSTQDSVNVQYKEFGTKLKFKPEILDDGKIRLSIEPEVSSLNTANGVTIGSTEVPGFDSTKVKSVVELRENETFVVSGLLQQKQNNVETGVPFLRRVPVLGKLFQSTTFRHEEIEFLIVVTPEILTPDKAPLPAESEKGDILSTATKMDAFRVGDDQGEAIQKYLKENKRFLVEKMNKSGSGRSPLVTIQPKQVDTTKAMVPSRALDEIESQLKWESPKPKEKASG